ncbi:N-acetyl-gamma-glutamyl-phosphate reductase [Halolamina salifodinae]|uniref:N-acetyl-gamma-glutamyl-phosphate reductase n=1 Tax=Halolamina salifodinae TaxID=1202767 RepID=A0A8T4GWT5_9EURY|nr:N-acetyl-gamma-glutamyl-phosphate reductase [Halolamina salifodinae]MBP1987369.1 N-acetyl-gamma-glutamyl-phosphate/LysW-gamma-L-alpha-aminoadipyl-6-phosphate reductase [Halolamina salifodinae]
MTLTASVVGASGFAGGELLRLLISHPEFEVVQATSREYENRTVGHVHPNLRELDLRFSDPAELESVDALFAATPHGVSMEHVEEYLDAAGKLIDLSADFRLDSEAAYDQWYDGHSAPQFLSQATYALPELGREGLEDADIVASGGCNATATMLALKPLVDAGMLAPDDQVVADLKVGSSEGGAGGGAASSHPERSGVVRPYAPTGHRHEAEIEEHFGLSLSFTVHAVDMVRGAAATCHTFPTGPGAEGGVETADLWGAYREAYGDEPFVRLVAGGGGVYRYPEPKSVAGTNLAEVGFAADGDRVVAFAAIDNVMKGAAGQAVHGANLAFGLDETAGLNQTGLHPVGSP